MSKTLNTKLNQELNKLFVIWEKLKIFSKEQIEVLKFHNLKKIHNNKIPIKVNIKVD